MLDHDLRKALGTVIAILRKERDLSQEQLALEAEIARAHMGVIERGEANISLETLEKIAGVLNQTVGTLVVQAEEMAAGVTRKPVPIVNPNYVDRMVPLPTGLTYDQLEQALNQAMTVLYQIGLNPDSGDIQRNIYSGIVSNVVTKAIAEHSDFIQNKDTSHPDLYNPNLPVEHLDYGLEMKATHQLGKGGESHNPGRGWFMVVIYKVIDKQTQIVQVETTRLQHSDWVIHDRGEESNRTRTAITRAEATKRLRANSVYLHPDYTTPQVELAIRERKQQRLL